MREGGRNSLEIDLMKVIPREKWKPDGAVQLCQHCKLKFSFTVRKHHCRVCGDIFCDSCSPEIAIYLGDIVRVCGTCTMERTNEIKEMNRQQKEKENRILQLRIEEGMMMKQEEKDEKDSTPLEQKRRSKPPSPYSSSPQSNPSSLSDSQNNHKFRQQQMRLKLALQEEEEKERERQELKAVPWKSTTWTPSSERIHYQDLGYSLENTDSAPPVPVTVVDKSKWMLDTDTVKCMDCGYRFDSVIRRHHCRVCGAIFCDACSPEIGIYYGGHVRVCADCYHHAKATHRTEQQETEARKAVVTEALKWRKSEILGEKRNTS